MQHVPAPHNAERLRQVMVNPQRPQRQLAARNCGEASTRSFNGKQQDKAKNQDNTSRCSSLQLQGVWQW